jgi:ABC-type transport system substrate-binding protein/protocatechuate 3,4-dioxygenase beta subunit
MTAFAVFPTAHAKAAAAGDEKTLYVALQQDMPDFNTWNLASNSVWKADVINWGFEALAGLDKNLVPYPLLAESWDFNQTDPDNLFITVNLRQGVLFHDGTEMTADDVVFTYTAARSGTAIAANIINAFDNDSSGSVSLAEIQADVVKIDTYTVRMFLARPYGQFFTTTMGVPIVPKHIWYNAADPANDHTTDDMIFDVLWNDVKATYSTGPYKYKDGQAGIFRVMEKNPDYWGKDFETPYLHYKVYPPNVDTIYFKIYSSIDTAILALQSGAVDFIAWPITAGRIPILQADPSIGMTYLSDNGYFYLAFNEKFQPMGDLSFRKAVSYLIDKDQIVNTYMGGFGAKGSAVEPPFWGEWHNESVETYPYDASLAASNDLLDAAGFLDANADGWRELPDGSAMPKITILTPPADYDPIRIRAGQMIAKNMRDCGLNAEAKALDFDTLVARLQSMDYQMLIIGWSLASEPVGNVFDIIGPKANQNTFGFWAVDDPNPFYKDLMGVNTLADAATQADAKEVSRLGALARGTFSVAEQISYTRWAEGVIADAVPVNVLYYRVNAEAYSKAWTGWTDYLGDLWSSGANIFCLSSLSRTGGAGPSALGSVNAAISLPGLVGVGNSVTGFVKAVDKEGNPVSGASVAMTVAGIRGDPTVSVSPATGTTSADGLLDITVTGTATGYSYVNTTVTYSGATSTKSAIISSVTEYPQTLYVSVSPEELVLRAGEQTNVNLMVTDQNGDPVEGVNLSVDPNLISYGSIDDVWLASDADGMASTIYHAPASVVQMNQHETLTLAYFATKEGYVWTGAAAANLLIYNPDAPAWILTRVSSVTTTALATAANLSDIVFQVVDDEGNPIADQALDVTYSNESMVVGPVASVTSDAGGNAPLTVIVKGGTPTQALRVTVGSTELNATPATVTLTYVGDVAPTTEMYGGYMTFAQPAQYLGPLGALDVTAHIWNSTGVAADGILASLLVSGTQYGTLTWTDLINWDSTYDGWGINIVTAADNGNAIMSGPFNTVFDYDNWDYWYNDQGYIYWDWGTMTGVDVVGGVVDFQVYGIDVVHLDLVGSMYVVPEGYGTFNGTTLSYQIDGQTMIASQYVIGRSYTVVSPSFVVENPVLHAKMSNYEQSNVSITVTDENNVPVDGASAMVYQNSLTGNADYKVYPGGFSSGSVTTDAAGQANESIIAIAKAGVYAASAKPNVFVKAMLDGAVSMFAQTQIFIYTSNMFVTLDPIESVVAIGETNITVTAHVEDFAGTSLPNMTVELTSDSGTVYNQPWSSSVQMSSWEAGHVGEAVFHIDTPIPDATKLAYMTLQVKVSGKPYNLALGSMVLTLQNHAPAISAALVGTTMAEMEFEEGTNVSLTGWVFDANGLDTVTVKLDSGTAQSVPATLTGSFAEQTRDISMLFTSLAVGQHTLTINATDSLSVSSQTVLTFTVSAPSHAGTDWAPWSLAAVGWAVAVILGVMMLMRRPKKPAPGPEETPKT